MGEAWTSVSAFVAAGCCGYWAPRFACGHRVQVREGFQIIITQIGGTSKGNSTFCVVRLRFRLLKVHENALTMLQVQGWLWFCCVPWFTHLLCTPTEHPQPNTTEFPQRLVAMLCPVLTAAQAPSGRMWHRSPGHQPRDLRSWESSGASA